MLPFNHVLCSFAVLVMASAQSTSLPTTINTDSTSEVQTSYTLTGTSIAAATGTPPPLASTTIHVASTAATSAPAPSSTTTTTPANSTLSVPAIAGLAAGGALVLIVAIIVIAVLCIKRRRKPADEWPNLPVATVYQSIGRPVSFQRPLSAATLVAAPAQAYTHSKGTIECTSAPLSHSKSAKSIKSSRSTILERVSEEGVSDFKFDFGVPPRFEITPPSGPAAAARSNDDALQKLSLDKSLPSMPAQHQIPMDVLDLEKYQATTPDEENGRPRSSVYSNSTGKIHQRDTWANAPDRQSYF